MTHLRQRGMGPTSQLEEPLLRALTTPAAGEELDGELRHTGMEPGLPVGLSGVVRIVLAVWHLGSQLLTAVLRVLRFGQTPHEEPFSLLQMERLAGLRQRAAVAFNSEVEEHQAALQALWSVAFAGSSFPMGTTHPQWKVLGFQSECPCRDFRGGGFLSLEALVWMAQRHPDTFYLLMRKDAGRCSTWEYPFAAGGINIAFMLTEILELRQQDSAPPTTSAARGFLALLAENELAFEELFVLTYRLLDAVWLQQAASYMEFPRVLFCIRRKVEQSLSSGGRASLQQLERLLHA